MKRALKVIQQILNQKSMTASDLVNVMNKFRLFLEDVGAQRKYPTLLLYGNWVAHPKLDKARAIEIIEFLNDAFVACSKSDSEKWVADAAIESFRLHVLHDEIRAFAGEFGVSLPVFDQWENWVSFAWGLIEELTERPITLPDTTTNKKIEKRLDALMDKWEAATSNRNALVSMRLARSDGKYIWVAELLNGAVFMGDMAIISQEMVDKYSRPNR